VRLVADLAITQFLSPLPTPAAESTRALALPHKLKRGLPSPSIRSPTRQTGSGKDGLKSEVVKHAFHDAHTAPGGDFFVGKTQVKFHPNPRTKNAIA
jgi:hypothetical protein